MERTKPPALTSPWKVGFLVALMLVLMSIGVGYFLTRTFGLSWSWLQFTGGSWTSWQFDLDRFLVEMAPLAVLVAVLSISAFLMVAGAVRRYKRYVHSGSDYRQLIKSLKKIEDLSQHDRINRLTQHPELRDFLLKVSRSIAEREQTLEGREAKLAERESQADLSEQLSTQSGVLVDAIMNANTDGFAGTLDLSIPSLKEIESAVKNHLVSPDGGSLSSPGSSELIDELRDELSRAKDEFLKSWSDIADEVDATESTSRDIESQLGALQNTVLSLPENSGEDAGALLAGALDGVKDVSQSLQALSEETKSIAINAALKAGDGGSEELIRLADDVRDVAARFNGVSERGTAACAGAETALAQAQSTAAGGTDVGQAIGAVLSTVQLWVERMVLLHERLNALQDRQVNYVSDLMSRLDGDTAPATVMDADTSDEPADLSETAASLEIEHNTFTAPADAPAEAPAETVADIGEGFERTSGLDLSGAAPAETDDFEVAGTAPLADKESAAEPVDTEEDYFDSIPADVEPAAAVDEVPAAEPEPASPAADDAESGVEGVLQPFTSEEPVATGEQGDDAPDRMSAEHAAGDTAGGDETDAFPLDNFVTASVASPKTDEAAESDGSENAVDLYELGAVDYEPEKHTV